MLGFILNKFWSLDLPAIAGIIAVIGTGVDQQIVVLDESRSSKNLSLKQISGPLIKFFLILHINKKFLACSM